MNVRISLFLTISLLFPISTFAVEDHAFGPDLIDVSVSPLRFEINGLDNGQIITKTIKVINNSEFPINFTPSIEDCTTSDTNGTPDCKLPAPGTDVSTSLALWSSISPSSFSIPANSERDVTLSIAASNTASPGGKYAAVFFSTGKKQGQVISTIKRIGVLILYTVPGNPVFDTKISLGISDGGGAGAGDKSKGNFSNLKETIFGIQKELVSGANDLKGLFSSEEEKNIKTQFEKDQKEKEKQEAKKNESNIKFSVSFENEGNTHIKPSGKIEILDEGEIIKKISKELIKSDNDAILGEKMVDYIPVNDQGGNVLPGSKRDFFQEWKGFPYEIVNEKGEKEIRYRSFGEYYSNKNLSDRKLLMFWEQVKTRDRSKGLIANIKLSYPGKDGKDEEFNSAREFSIVYQEEYIGKNWFVIAIGSIIGLIGIWGIRLSILRRRVDLEEFRKLKNKLKHQEHEIDIIEDLVEHMPAKTRKKIFKKK